MSERASNLKPLIALLPSVLSTTFCFLLFESPSTPDSTTKNGPIPMYTVWIIIESDIITVPAQTRFAIRGMTDVRAWKISLS